MNLVNWLHEMPLAFKDCILVCDLIWEFIYLMGHGQQYEINTCQICCQSTEALGGKYSLHVTCDNEMCIRLISLKPISNCRLREEFSRQHVDFSTFGILLFYLF